jgi:hypothetical protein
MYYLHEQLANQRIQQLRDQATRDRLVRQARRTLRLTRIGKSWWRRGRQPARRRTPADIRPAHTFETSARG